MKPKQIAMIAIPAAAVIAGVIFWQMNSTTPVAVVEPIATPKPITTAPQPVVRNTPKPEEWTRSEPIEQPTPEPEPTLLAAPTDLDSSDPQVHSLVKILAPEFTQWLLPQQQIRKWVATVDMMAEGRYPRKYPAIDFPLGKFVVEKQGDSIHQADSNFKRADVLISALTKIEPQQLADYYQQWQPIFEKAYKEQGKRDRFTERLALAIDTIIGLEPLPENATLKQPHVFYTYADPALEQRSDLEKLVWRLGTDNQQALQAYLKQLKPLL